MKSYILVISKTGDNLAVDSKLHTESYNGHIKNMTKMIGANNFAIAYYQ